MFLERHVDIYDPKHRYIDLVTKFKSLPGWKQVSEWEVDDETGYLKCSAGWMVMYDQYYYALLGSRTQLGFPPDGKSRKFIKLMYKNIGAHYIDGVLTEDTIKTFPEWEGPPPPPPIGSCIIL